MTRERVYDAARRLGVSSGELRQYLQAHGYVVRSVSSLLSDGAGQLVAKLAPGAGLPSIVNPVPPPPPVTRRPEVFWSWEWEDDEDWFAPAKSYSFSHWVGPDEVTVAQAAAAYYVSPATVRQWVSRGLLIPARCEGRANIFTAEAVNRAALQAKYRSRQPMTYRPEDQDCGPIFEAPPIAACWVDSRTMSALLPAPEVSALTGIPASTIRSWAHRGHIQALAHQGRIPLFLVADVVGRARRAPYRPRRKPLR